MATMLTTSVTRTARTAGSAALLVGLGIFAACVDGGTDDVQETGEVAFEAGEVIDQAQAVVNGQLDEVLTALDQLDVELAELEANPLDQDARANAQDAWFTVHREWQHVEVMQMGQLGSSLTVVAGADVRDEVYSWPSVNPCRVDQETVESNWDQPEFFTANLVNSYGVDALEQLLFGPEEDQCVSQVGIDSDWANLGTEGVASNRVAFAQAVSGGIRAHAEVGVDLSYADDQEGLNEILRALFYLDKITKDLKLARTAGIKDCGTEICPEEAESQVAGASTDAVHANLEGFRILFTGGEGAGLDDLLIGAGREDLATDILVQLDEAEAAALAVGGPLDVAVVDDMDAVLTLHAEVKDVTDLLKGELTTVLALQIPIEASGDND